MHNQITGQTTTSLIAQDAQYHVQCLVSLYNRARETKPSDDSDVHTVNEGIAFAELVSYIEDSCMDTLVALVFKLTDKVNLYCIRLKQPGTGILGDIAGVMLSCQSHRIVFSQSQQHYTM